MMKTNTIIKTDFFCLLHFCCLLLVALYISKCGNFYPGTFLKNIFKVPKNKIKKNKTKNKYSKSHVSYLDFLKLSVFLFLCTCVPKVCILQITLNGFSGVNTMVSGGQKLQARILNKHITLEVAMYFFGT